MSHVLILAGFLAFPIFERLPPPPLAGQWSEGGQRCRPAFSGTGITVAGTASDFPSVAGSPNSLLKGRNWYGRPSPKPVQNYINLFVIPMD